MTGWPSAQRGTPPKERPTEVDGGGPPRVAVLVVNFFSAEQVASLLASTVRHTSHPERLVVSVVDNSQSAAEWAALSLVAETYSSTFADLVLTDAGENLGYGRGNNLALQRALRAESIRVAVVANPDVQIIEGDLYGDAIQVSDGVVCSAVTVVKGSRLAGVAAIGTLTSKSRQLRAGEKWSDLALPYPAGHILAMTVPTWQRADGFDPDFFLYGEELDLTLRLGLTPDRIGTLPSVAVAHLSGGTTGSVHSKSAVTYRNATRSMVLLYRKHRRLSRWLPAMVVARLAMALHALSRGRGVEAKAVVAGLHDGLTYRLPQSAARLGRFRSSG